MLIYVHKITGPIYTLDVEPSFTIGEIMTALQCMTGLKRYAMRLIFQRKQEERDRTLSDCNIQDGSKIFLVPIWGLEPCKECLANEKNPYLASIPLWREINYNVNCIIWLISNEFLLELKKKKTIHEKLNTLTFNHLKTKIFSLSHFNEA